MTHQTNKQNNFGDLFRLSWRILDEEIKIFNKATRKALGVQTIYAKDKVFWIRKYSRNPKILLRLAQYITDKKLDKIDFSENSIDQLKVRIILKIGRAHV